MSRVVMFRRTAFGLLVIGATCAVLGPPAAVADDCNAAGLAARISWVTADLNVYFVAHPDDLPALQAPLTAYKVRCGLQVLSTDALAVLAKV
jgi:hypothetical protein